MILKVIVNYPTLISKKKSGKTKIPNPLSQIIWKKCVGMMRFTHILNIFNSFTTREHAVYLFFP